MTTIEKFTTGAQLFACGVIDELELLELANRARKDVDLAPVKPEDATGFFARIREMVKGKPSRVM
jgi:hypothetical protein